MASLAEDKGMNAAAGNKSGSMPITSHKFFPAIVATWFGALMGLGSLVVPVQVIEQLVTATGISSIFSFAAPPLGMTARALIALAFAASGALAGLYIARKVGQAHAPENAEIEADTSVRPISALDELGEKSFDGKLLKSRTPLIARSVAEPIADKIDVLELDELGLEAPISAPNPGLPIMAAIAIDAETASEPDEDAIDSAWMDIGEPVEPLSFSAPSMASEDSMLDEELVESEEIALEDEFEGLPPITFDGAEFEAEAPEPEVMAAIDLSDDFNDEFEDETEDETEDAPQEFQLHKAPVTDWQALPLDELGLVQLVERLGSSIVKRRELREQQVRAAEAVVPVVEEAAILEEAGPISLSDDPEMAAPDDAAQAMAAYFGKAEADHVEAVQIDITPAAEAEVLAAENQECVIESGHESGPEAKENERALRDALLNLQRMNGAA